MHSGGPHIEGFIVRSSGDVCELIGLRPASIVLLADLFAGTWKPHHIATEFARQLSAATEPGTAGLPDEPALPFAASGGDTQVFPFAAFVKRGVDAESAGTHANKKISAYIDRIIGAAAHFESCCFAVLFPSGSAVFGEENYLFLKTFASRLRATDRLILISPEESAARNRFEFVAWTPYAGSASPVTPMLQPAGSLVGLVPGVMDPDVLGILKERPGFLFPVNDRAWFLPFEYRIPPVTNNKLKYDQIARISGALPWLQAYGYMKGNVMFQDRKLLQRYVYHLIGSECYDLALIYLKHMYVSTSLPLEKAIVACQLQGLRIALWKFGDAADQEPVSTGVPRSLADFLWLSKAWGAVMCNRIEDAGRFFQGIAHLLEADADESNEMLYLRNIYALYLYKSNLKDAALAKEWTIEAALNRQIEKNFHLAFVNGINTARLYRDRKDFLKAMDYYRQAFSTTTGIQTESDLIYYNLLLGKSYQSLEQPGDAFRSYLRSALHWVVCQDADMVNRRLKANVGYQEQAGRFEDFFSGYLVDMLRKTLPFDITEASGTLRFCRIEDMDTHNAIASGNEWATIVFSNDAVGEPASDGALSGLLHGILHSAGLLKGVDGRLVVAVDNHSGFDMPDALPEFAFYCFRHALRTAIWDGVRLGEDVVSRSENVFSSGVALHPGISRLESKDGDIVIHYKRYLPASVVREPAAKRILGKLMSDPERSIELSSVPHVEDSVDRSALLREWCVNKFIYFN